MSLRSAYRALFPEHLPCPAASVSMVITRRSVLRSAISGVSIYPLGHTVAWRSPAFAEEMLQPDDEFRLDPMRCASRLCLGREVATLLLFLRLALGTRDPYEHSARRPYGTVGVSAHGRHPLGSTSRR